MGKINIQNESWVDEFDKRFLDMSYIDNEIWFANIFMPDGEPKKYIGENDRIGLPMVYINSIKSFISNLIQSSVAETKAEIRKKIAQDKSTMDFLEHCLEKYPDDWFTHFATILTPKGEKEFLDYLKNKLLD